MEFLYSIIIPHYNSSSLLNRMLKSIPEREDIQVIVVDDCSKIDEVEKLKKLQHKNLELFLQSENHGAGYARNVGLDHAKGKWVLVVDADDVFAENAFDVFDKYKDSSVDHIGFCIKCVDTNTLMPNGRKIVSDESVRRYLKNKNERTLNLYKYKNTVCWNKLVSIDLIRQNHIRFEDCMVNNDVFYALQVGYYSKSMTVLGDELYYFTENPESITHKKRSVEREFQFYLQVQKRNGFYWKMGLRHLPFYRHDILYLPYMLKKRGIRDTIEFFKLWWQRREERLEAQKAYLFVFENKSKP